MDPRNGEMLALANWPRVDANDIGDAPGLRAPEPRRRLQLRAGLDVQGRSRSPGALEEGSSTPQTRFTCRRRSRSPTATIERGARARDGTLTVADILAQSSNVGTVTIGLKLGAERFDHWVRRFGFGRRPASTCPARSRGHRADAATSTRAPRSATCRSARASRSRRCRWPRPTRRSPTAASLHAPARGRGRRAPRAQRVISRATAEPGVARCSRACSRPGGTAQEAAIEGYKLAGKTGTAQKPDPRRRLLEDQVLRLVHRLRPGRATRGCWSR